ncbi:hypothetical protein KIPB_007846, partial [Kipferlia bialata]|eukprot:g7846.t1
MFAKYSLCGSHLIAVGYSSMAVIRTSDYSLQGSFTVPFQAYGVCAFRPSELVLTVVVVGCGILSRSFDLSEGENLGESTLIDGETTIIEGETTLMEGESTLVEGETLLEGEGDGEGEREEVIGETLSLLCETHALPIKTVSACSLVTVLGTPWTGEGVPHTNTVTTAGQTEVSPCDDVCFGLLACAVDVSHLGFFAVTAASVIYLGSTLVSGALSDDAVLNVAFVDSTKGKRGGERDSTKGAEDVGVSQEGEREGEASIETARPCSPYPYHTAALPKVYLSTLTGALGICSVSLTTAPRPAKYPLPGTALPTLPNRARFIAHARVESEVRLALENEIGNGSLVTVRRPFPPPPPSLATLLQRMPRVGARNGTEGDREGRKGDSIAQGVPKDVGDVSMEVEDTGMVEEGGGERGSEGALQDSIPINPDHKDAARLAADSIRR